jgi:hypothetical protein
METNEVFAYTMSKVTDFLEELNQCVYKSKKVETVQQLNNTMTRVSYLVGQITANINVLTVFSGISSVEENENSIGFSLDNDD